MTKLKIPHNDLEFYHVISTNLGNRYFKVDRINNIVWKICVNSGDNKKGRPHCEGIYKIAMSSFMGTYYWFFGRKSGGNTACLLTTHNQYNKALNEVIEKFK